MKTVDTMLMGRKTCEVSLRLGAKFDSTSKTIVFSRRHQHVPLDLKSVERFDDGLAQLHYRIQSTS